MSEIHVGALISKLGQAKSIVAVLGACEDFVEMIEDTWESEKSATEELVAEVLKHVVPTMCEPCIWMDRKHDQICVATPTDGFEDVVIRYEADSEGVEAAIEDLEALGFDTRFTAPRLGKMFANYVNTTTDI